MTIQLMNEYLVIQSPLKSRNIDVFIRSQIDIVGLLCFYIVNQYADNGIGLTGFRIFVSILNRVQIAIVRYGIFLYFAFIERIKCYFLRVGTPKEPLCYCELFLIDPIGCSVYYFIELSVGCDLSFLHIRYRKHEQIIGFHISHLAAIGSELRQTYFVLVDRGKLFGLYIIYIIVRQI